MDDETRKHLAYLKEQHRLSCFETGDHPDEVETPYSKGAEAIERLQALDARAATGRASGNEAPGSLSAQKYHDLANATFHPNMINDPEDEPVFFRVCRDLMHANGLPCPETDDDKAFTSYGPLGEEHPAMAFFYRARELCEIAECGYTYHKVDGRMIAETIANSKAACFKIEDPEEDLEMSL